MGTSVLKRNEGVVWLPPRVMGERAFATEPVLRVGLAGPTGMVVQVSSLDALPKLRQLRLVFDARDVNLLSVKLPPLSGARLRQAVPSALEDRLLQDPQTCLFALGPVGPGGERSIAVMDRAWFEFVLGAFERRGMRVTGALPGQLAAPLQPGADTLMCVGDGLALRTGPTQGMGWPAAEQGAARVASLVSLLNQRMLERDEAAPERISAYADAASWHMPIEAAAATVGVTVSIQDLPIPADSPIDLLAGREGSGVGRWFADVDWRAWRWPTGWAVTVLLAFLIGLNLHWGRLLGERNEMRASLERSFRQSFPKVTVVVDPLIQAERELALLRTRAGQSGPADFVPLLARLGLALGPQATGAMNEVQYRDGRLSIRFAPALAQSGAVREQLIQAARRGGLKLEFGDSGAAAPGLATVSPL